MPRARSSSDFDRSEQVAALRLARGRGIGPILYGRLISRFGLPSRALEALPELAARAQAKVSAAPAAAAERELAVLARMNGRLLVRGEPLYPTALDTQADAPAVLSVLGDPGLLARDCIAIVGARNASLAGRQIAEGFARDLAGRGYAVVSGLARGIDTAAHVGALAAGPEGGGTIAVMAGGLDHIYPRENERLFTDIAASGGAVVAETALGTVPTARHFPRRNRIVSGLSQGVVVVEAAAKSGSLITARLAADQGREVFAVPGSPLDQRCRGSNGLIRDGAWLVECCDDIVANMPLNRAAPAQRDRAVKSASVNDRFYQEIQIDEAGAGIVDLLSSGPTPVDEIVRQCQTSPSIVAGVLLELELAGRLERHPGNAVSLIA